MEIEKTEGERERIIFWEREKRGTKPGGENLFVG